LQQSPNAVTTRFAYLCVKLRSFLKRICRLPKDGLALENAHSVCNISATEADTLNVVGLCKKGNITVSNHGDEVETYAAHGKLLV